MKVRAPAKINLALQIVGARPDGYHELRTIFQSIALHDTLTIRIRRGPFTLRCDDPACPADGSNLVWRAAERVWAAAGRSGRPRDAEVTLTKRIPMRAGLGGGSSDAAAAVRAFASLWRLREDRLHRIAMSIGADVPFFLEGGTALGLDRGDLLFPLAEPPAAWVVIACPRFGVSTADAYAWWDDANSGGARHARPAARQAEHRRAFGGNDLQRPVAAHHPEIARIAARFDRAGAFHAAMTGSGSGVFGLFDRRQAAVAAAGDLARQRRAAPAMLITRTVNRAAYQRLAGIRRHRVDLPFALRSQGHS